jgi:hypothetical protein
MEMLNAPPLITRSGKILYAIIVPIWWSISFIIAIAIPDYFGFVSVVAASMLMNLTYAIPPFAALGFDIQKNAIRSGEGFDPNTGRVIKTDTGVKRWWRGFWSGGTVQVGMNVWHVVYFLCALAMCGLGMYAAVDG